jgi:hypothetical protein
MPLAALLAAIALTAAPCTHGQVRLHVGRGSRTAGTIFYPLTFIDHSARACTLTGFPGVSSVTRRHRQVGSPATRDRGLRVRAIRLRANGGAATALVGIVDTGALPRASCRPVGVWGLKVFAPNQRRPFFAHVPHSACSRPAASNMHVRPVVRGSTGL